MLDIDIRNATTLGSFKKQLYKKKYINGNKLLLYGSNVGAINQARVRMGLIGLNQQRKKYPLIFQSNCPNCNHRTEDATHYFLKCQHFAAHREELYAGITSVLAPNVHHNLLTPQSAQDLKDYLHIILYGSDHVSYEENCLIFDNVHNFITKTKRFAYTP